MTIQSATFATNSPITLHGLLSSDNESTKIPIDAQVIKLTISDKNGKEIFSGPVNAARGSFLFPIAALAQGTYNVAVVFDGDDNYNPNSLSFVLNIVPRSTAISQIHMYPSQAGTKGVFTVTATLSGCPANDPQCTAPSSLVDGADVHVLLNGKDLGTITTVNGSVVGKFTAASKNLGVGDHALVLQFSGNANYTGSASQPVPFVVTASKVEIVVSQPANVQPGEKVVLSGKVTIDKVPLVAPVVIAYDGGPTQTLQSASDGSFGFSFTPNIPGTQLITISVPQTVTTTPASTSITLNVLKQEAQFSITGIRGSVKVDQPFRLDGRIFDAKSKSGISVPVELQILGPDGQFGGKISSTHNGTFAFNVQMTTPGQYTLRTNFVGTNIYKNTVFEKVITVRGQ